LFLPALLALVSLIEGENCPAPVDVAARVRTILHLSPEQQLSEGFAVERHEAGLYVALRGADSSLIGERTLPTAGSCDELAQAAAVVLAAWLSDVHPDFAGALPAPAVQVPEAPSNTQPGAPPPAAAKAAPPPSSPPLPPPAAAPTVRRRLHVVAGLGGDLTNGELSPALLLGASFGAEVSGLAVSARALVTLTREQPLEPGLVTWRRWPLGIGPSLRLATSAWALSLSAGPAMAWLRLGGESYDRVAEANGLVWGGFGEVLVSGRGYLFAPFGALSVQYYPANTTAYVGGSDLSWDLPKLSATVVVGARLAP
jgi:hypothetical protein